MLACLRHIFITYLFFQPINRHENCAPDNNVEDIAAASATQENVSEDEKSCDESTTLLFNVSGALEESEQEPQAEDQKEAEDEPQKETDEMIKKQVSFRIFSEHSLIKVLQTFCDVTADFPEK